MMNFENEFNYEDVALGNGEWVTDYNWMSPKEYDEEYSSRDGIDLITTLENHYDHAFLAKYELEIVNDYTIYTRAIGLLIKDYWLYDYVKATYGKYHE